MMPSQAVVTSVPLTPTRSAIAVPIEASKPTTSFFSLTKLKGGYWPDMAMRNSPEDLIASRSSALAEKAVKLAAKARVAAIRPEMSVFMVLFSSG